MLKRYLLPAYSAALVKQIRTHFKWPEQWDGHHLLAILRSTSKQGLSFKAKKLLLAYMSGTVPTGTVLAKWGYQISDKCPLCGCQDTAFHRVWICSGVSEARKTHLAAQVVREAIDHCEDVRFSRAVWVPPAAPPCADPVLIGFFVNHAQVPLEAFPGFSPDWGPVYVDGSAVEGRTPFAQAGFAALQIGPNGDRRHLMGRVPTDYPQTSDIAEHIGFFRLLEHSQGPIVVVTDCQGVKDCFDMGPALADDPKRPLAGIWREIAAHRDKVASIVKIKSHLTQKAAEAMNMAIHWRGNMEVDLLAKEAASRGLPPLVDRLDFLKAHGQAIKVCKGIARMLEAWPLPAPRFGDLPRARNTTTAKQPGFAPHRFSWEPDVAAWICSECRRWKRHRCSFIDKFPCCPLPAGMLEATKIHPSHQVYARPVANGITSVVFCRRCGLYTQARLSKLKAPCRADKSSSAYRRYTSTIAAGIHPRNKTVLGRAYSLGMAIRAACAQSTVAASPETPPLGSSLQAGSGWSSDLPGPDPFLSDPAGSLQELDAEGDVEAFLDDPDLQAFFGHGCSF
jgi:hypothetical protein